MPVTTYRVFVRDWWRMERGQRVPNPGARKATLPGGTSLAYDEAREMAQTWNAAHDPGPLSRKAEFEQE